MLSSEELASELGRQRRLYDELLDKTHQIQSVRVHLDFCGYIFVCVFIVSVHKYLHSRSVFVTDG